jgi:phosphatidylglycerol:prolipoprotein diacylglycerol transferase
MKIPVELSIGHIEINLHLLFEVLGYFIGFRYFLYLKKSKSDVISESNRIWILIGASAGSLLFSRLIGALENPNEWSESKYPLLYFYQNKTILGGLLGGLVGVELIKKVIREKNSSGDLFTYPLILSIMIGRIGCFTSGIKENTYGTPTTFFTGLDLGDGLQRHPVALYEICFLLFVWLLLLRINKKSPLKNGFTFQIFMIAYLIYRFFQEFIKPSYFYSFGLSTIQITAIIGLIYYYKTIFIILLNPSKLTLDVNN